MSLLLQHSVLGLETCLLLCCVPSSNMMFEVAWHILVPQEIRADDFTRPTLGGALASSSEFPGAGETVT